MSSFVFRSSLLAAGFCLLSTAAFVLPAHAEDDMIDISADLKFQSIGEKDGTLPDISEDWTQSGAADLRIKVTAKPYTDTTIYAEGRAVDIGGNLGVDDDTGSTSSAEDFVEWRQSWIKFTDIAGIAPLGLQAGRQRISEPRGLWWNKDIDAVRVLYDSTEFSGFLGLAENLASYTSTSDFMEDEQDRLRVLGEGSWLFAANNRLEGRFLYENDHSGMEDIGSRIRANDRDTEDDNLFWGGVRLAGENPAPRMSSVSGVGYSVELLGVGGEEQLQTSAATADPDFRRVTGANVRDVFGWALDANLDVTFDAPLRPTVVLGYAFGSGDDGEGNDSGFRQSDLQGNSSRLGVSSSGVRNYGEVLRPELSNLHILTAGVGVPVMSASDTSLVYHAYWLAQNATSLRSSGVDGALNGDDRYVGQGLDLITNVALGDDFGLKGGYLKDTKLRIALGGFDAGSAYGTEDDEMAYRGLMELKFRF